jgi:DNA-binding transcriptional LysR family regulator
MRMNHDLNLLTEMTTFVRVVETGSFSSAAVQLGITPSAVSRQIGRLEQALSTRLLERTTRKLRLSESGTEAFKRCQEMVFAARTVMAMSGTFSGEAEGLIRVSTPKAFGRFVVHPHMPEFLRLYPKVDVQLILDDRYVDLIDDHVDLAIRITDQPAPGLAGRPLMPVDHLICASPTYLNASGHPQHPSDLRKHSCLYLGENINDRQWKFIKDSESVTVNVHGRYIANHTEVRLEGVLEHFGVGSLPFFTARKAIQAGLITRVLPDWDFIASYYGAAWILYSPTRYLSPKLRVFIDYIAGCLKAEPTLK